MNPARPEITFGLKRWQEFAFSALIVVLVSIPIFVHLDVPVIRLWDESRRAVNAYEMLHNHQWLVTHFDGEPEMWGTKPPLLIWLQVMFMKILGPGELAVRLPSALAALVTCLSVFFFSARYLGNMLFGFLWAMVLVTSNSYIDFHGTRSGDFDALLIMFMVLYSLSFFLFIKENRTRYLYATAIFISLATLNKGIAGLLFIPGLLLYAIYNKSFLAIFRNKHTWYGFLIFVLLVFGYYLARESVNPGYLRAVWENELGGRYLQTLEDNRQDFWFFIRDIRWPGLNKWWYFIFPGMLLGLFFKERKFRNLVIFSVMIVTTHLLIISLSETKLAWYSLPVYPFLAMFIAAFSWAVIYWILQIAEKSGLKYLKVLALVVTFLIFYEPSRLMFQKVSDPAEKPWHLEEHQVLYVLRDGLEGKRDLHGTALVSRGPDQHCLFYLYLLEDEGVEVVRKPLSSLQPGDRVIVYEREVWAEIEKYYPFELTEALEFVRFYLIL